MVSISDMFFSLPHRLSVQMEEDEKSLEFYTVASDLIQGEVANKVGLRVPPNT